MSLVYEERHHIYHGILKVFYSPTTEKKLFICNRELSQKIYNLLLGDKGGKFSYYWSPLNISWTMSFIQSQELHVPSHFYSQRIVKKQTHNPLIWVLAGFECICINPVRLTLGNLYPLGSDLLWKIK